MESFTSFQDLNNPLKVDSSGTRIIYVHQVRFRGFVWLSR
ncbi:unnamed protein product [Brassica oleracea var. botrytis]|uniref:(rape) hypothetical protein n=1 Tax=Brassica napus TaxID=3708 RepID=A0A816IBY8_BRANA|nr:unnamed protein product [Brassica napus]